MNPTEPQNVPAVDLVALRTAFNAHPASVVECVTRLLGSLAREANTITDSASAIPEGLLSGLVRLHQTLWAVQGRLYARSIQDMVYGGFAPDRLVSLCVDGDYEDEDGGVRFFRIRRVGLTLIDTFNVPYIVEADSPDSLLIEETPDNTLSRMVGYRVSAANREMAVSSLLDSETLRLLPVRMWELAEWMRSDSADSSMIHQFPEWAGCTSTDGCDASSMSC